MTTPALVADGVMKYFAVYKDGDDTPSDLVRMQPSGKALSIPDTQKERERNKKAGWQYSVFKWSEETDKDWVELKFSEVQDALSSGLKDYRRAMRGTERRSYSDKTKRLVIEARQCGKSWARISSQHGVPISTARRWVDNAVSYAQTVTPCDDLTCYAQPPEGPINTGPNCPNQGFQSQPYERLSTAID